MRLAHVEEDPAAWRVVRTVATCAVAEEPPKRRLLDPGCVPCYHTAHITTVKNFPVQCDDIVSSHGMIWPSENRHIELSPRGMIFYRLKRWWNMSRFVTILYRLMWWWVIVTQDHHLMGRYQIVTWDVCEYHHMGWCHIVTKNDINTSHETVNLIWFLRWLSIVSRNDYKSSHETYIISSHEIIK